MGKDSEKHIFKIPSPEEFKITDNMPDFQHLQKRLAAKGLKDPWIRNHAWAHDVTRFGSRVSQVKAVFTGFGVGLVLATLGGIYRIYLAPKPSHHDEYPLLNERHKQIEHY